MKNLICWLLVSLLAAPSSYANEDNDAIIEDLERRKRDVSAHAYPTMSNQSQLFVQHHLMMKREDVGRLMTHLHNLNIRYRRQIQKVYVQWETLQPQIEDTLESEQAIVLRRLAMKAQQIEKIAEIVNGSTHSLAEIWSQRCEPGYIDHLKGISDPYLMFSPDAIPTLPTRGFSFMVSYSWGSSNPTTGPGVGTDPTEPDQGAAISDDEVDAAIITAGTAIGSIFGPVGAAVGFAVGTIVVGFKRLFGDEADKRKIEKLSQEIYDIQMAAINQVADEVGPYIDKSCPEFLPDEFEGGQNQCDSEKEP
ncbi:MAG: hypothetical protein AAF202_08540, partial [Pseudomonadota bacterium]